MKTVCVALALAGSASAFIAPTANIRATSPRGMVMSAVDEPQSRAEVLSTVFKAGASVVAAAAIPTSAVFADGATSAATQARARGIYGTRIESLKPLVDKGDSAAVLAEQNAFKLFVSGVYSTDKAKKAEAKKLADAVLSAAKSGDAGALKSSYAAFIKYTAKPSGFSGAGEGQGFGSEFDYKNRTPLGTVYQR
ncbi:unnamed protein product [Sphacelaria rigidula]